MVGAALGGGGGAALGSSMGDSDNRHSSGRRYDNRRYAHDNGWHRGQHKKHWKRHGRWDD
jgi:hypothetical protein